MVHKENFEV